MIKRKIVTLCMMISLSYSSCFAGVSESLRAFSKTGAATMAAARFVGSQAVNLAKKPFAFFWKKKKLSKLEKCKQMFKSLSLELNPFSAYLVWYSLWGSMPAFFRRFRCEGSERTRPGRVPLFKCVWFIPIVNPLFYFYITVAHPIDFFTGWWTFNVNSNYEKFSRACKYLFNRRAKSMLNNVDDINAVFGESDRNREGWRPLHIAAYWGNLNIVRWLIEEKFADVRVLDARGRDASFHANGSWARVGGAPTSNIFFGSDFDKTRSYLQEAQNKHQELVNKVAELRGLDERVLDRESEAVEQEVERRMHEIKNLMQDRKTPGYAKQLVMSDLVRLHQQYPLVITQEDILGFYKKIAFNYVFLRDDQFRGAIEFAFRYNITDRDGNTVLQASSKYGMDSERLANMMLQKGDFYRRENMFRNYLSQTSTPNRGVWGKVASTPHVLVNSAKNMAARAKNIFSRKTEQYNSGQDVIRALNNAKKQGNKKNFRDLANMSLVMDDLKKIEVDGAGTTLPDELVAKIIGYSPNDFGNKINYS